MQHAVGLVSQCKHCYTTTRDNRLNDLHFNEKQKENNNIFETSKENQLNFQYLLLSVLVIITKDFFLQQVQHVLYDMCLILDSKYKFTFEGRSLHSLLIWGSKFFTFLAEPAKIMHMQSVGVLHMFDSKVSWVKPDPSSSVLICLKSPDHTS